MAFPQTLKYSLQAVASLAVGKVDSASPTISGTYPLYFASWGSMECLTVTREWQRPLPGPCVMPSPVSQAWSLLPPPEPESCHSGLAAQLRDSDTTAPLIMGGESVMGGSEWLTQFFDSVLYIWPQKKGSQSQTILDPRVKIIVRFGQKLIPAQFAWKLNPLPTRAQNWLPFDTFILGPWSAERGMSLRPRFSTGWTTNS